MHEEKEDVNEQVNKVSPLLAYKCEHSVRLLEERIADIPDVQTWASESGVSRRWLSKSMKLVYGKSPKIILREMKYEKVVWLISEEGVDASCYSVAVDTGFGNEIALSKFLKAFYETNFTKLKVEIVNEKA